MERLGKFVYFWGDHKILTKVVQWLSMRNFQLYFQVSGNNQHIYLVNNAV